MRTRLALGTLALALAACREAGSTPDAGAPDAGACAARLFGRPGPRTGLDESLCAPRCNACADGGFEQPEYTEADLAALERLTLLDPPAELTADPYATPAPAQGSGLEVCAVLREGDATSYRLRTFPSMDAARAAGAKPTHVGACGLCSSLKNLAVYLRTPDLTAPVRDCGVRHQGDARAQLACLEGLGFERPCAQIWSYNTDHTRRRCLDPCLAALTKPYHLEDGGLNECLQCDEDVSGPVFKAVAGRTRRNTGVASAMCRPCAEVTPLVHRY